MRRQANWAQVLVECKSTIIEQIHPLLKTVDQPQPDLGVGAGGDPLRQVDLVAEKAIADTLRKNGVSFTLISEESGVIEYGDTAHDCYVTTDPIDGTTNLARRIPFYATSIAVSTKPTLGTVYAALVADLFRDIGYVAQKGEGAYRDKKKIGSSQNVSLEDAVIGLDLNSYKVKTLIPRLNSLVQRTKHIRHFGANALELCYVADGTTDAFIDIRGKLRTTDIAAAYLVLNEAGAVMTMPDGMTLDVKLDPRQKVKFVASGNRELHETILDLIKLEKEAK
jgi:myo-inositol-1(or 4)-monophosphatase